MITYNISSHIKTGPHTYDNINHAVTGDGWIAYSLFYDMMKDHPDRTFAIEVFSPLAEDEEADFIQETEEGTMALLAYIQGCSSEADLDILTCNHNPEALAEAMTPMGISVA